MYPTIHQYSSQIQINKPTVHGQLNAKNKYKKHALLRLVRALWEISNEHLFIWETPPLPHLPPIWGSGGGTVVQSMQG